VREKTNNRFTHTLEESLIINGKVGEGILESLFVEAKKLEEKKVSHKRERDVNTAPTRGLSILGDAMYYSIGES